MPFKKGNKTIKILSIKLLIIKVLLTFLKVNLYDS